MAVVMAVLEFLKPFLVPCGKLIWAARGTWSKWKWVQKVKRLFQKKPTKATEFTVAITHLADDKKHVVRKQLMHALKDLPLEVSGFPRMPEFNDEGGQKELQRKLHTQAQAWLKESHTDLMIWGKMIPASGNKEQRVQLYFTAKDSPQQQEKTFNESEFFELPVQAKDALETMIRTQVLTRMANFLDAPPIVQALQDEVKRIRDTANKWPAGETRAAFQLALGSALQTIGDQLGDASALNESIAAYQDALKHGRRENDPLAWATTQNNLGAALQTLGERENRIDLLNEAVAAYREALQERTRERVRLAWAATQNNLGGALMFLGERENRIDLLNEAVAAYREALQERTRKCVPLKWAMTKNNLGAALTRLGERESGTECLNEALEVLLEALQERTREHVPLDWAMTQNNLGGVLIRLGERDQGPAGLQKLRDARAAFLLALEVYQSAKATYYIDVVRDNLKNLDALIQQRGG